MGKIAVIFEHMRRRNILILAGILLVLLLSAGGFWYVKNNLMKADVTTGATYISTTASVTYKDAEGNSYSETSTPTRIRKVEPLKLKYAAVSRSTAPNANLSIIESGTGGVINDSPLVLTPAAASSSTDADWTALPLDPDKTYDIRISIPGFLSKVTTNVALDSSAVLDTGSLHPGDLNQDKKINWQDYATWKAGYGQTVTNDLRDFNGDGKIDFFDFAVSFGSKCYNATEANQETQCGQ